jgi:hypothetical protein
MRKYGEIGVRRKEDAKKLSSLFWFLIDFDTASARTQSEVLFHVNLDKFACIFLDVRGRLGVYQTTHRPDQPFVRPTKICQRQKFDPFVTFPSKNPVTG